MYHKTIDNYTGTLYKKKKNFGVKKKYTKYFFNGKFHKSGFEK